MKAQQKIDKILGSVLKKIQDEVTALIGATLTLSEFENALISKEDFFDQPSSKQIAAKLEITGNVEGHGCLLVSIKDAIRLGGTLIMLPSQELEKVVSEEEYNEETKDSYGEIANIIAGAYTKVFEEMYPEPCRFIRKEQEILTPAKVVVESAEPVPNQLLYQITSSMELDDVKMGDLTVLLPAAAFGLEKEEETKPAEDKKPQTNQKEGSKEKNEPSAGNREGGEESENAQEEKPARPAFDVEKHRKRIDGLLSNSQKKIQEDIGALLGVDVLLDGLENRPVTKEDFFLSEVSGKQVLAHMKVTGDVEDKSYLFIGLKDAIRIGGTMIMLPPFELDAAVTEEEFSEDTADAYGEIANIIAGVYTSFFEEQYTKSLRFVKTELEQVVPMKVATESEEPLPDQTYYMSSSSVAIDGKPLGRIQVLFPSALLQLEDLGETQTVKKEVPISSSTHAEQEEQGEGKEVDILIISDDDKEAGKISLVLEKAGFFVKTLSFKNNVNTYISENLKAVFLVMHEVGEQAFGVAIKVSSSCSVPLIAAGPAWTRSKVIKAVKYGVKDILLTPASEQDIREKIDNNMVKLAA